MKRKIQSGNADIRLPAGYEADWIGHIEADQVLSGQQSFQQLYEQQEAFQRAITKIINMPADNQEWFGYHIKAMVEELGELLSADKRWKTHRNEKYDKENKLEELCDVFITAMNLCIFSGVDANELFEAVKDKIAKNTQKWEAKQKC